MKKNPWKIALIAIPIVLLVCLGLWFLLRETHGNDIVSGTENSMAIKKMIVASLIRSVRVKRNYEIEVELTVACEQFGLAVQREKLLDI